MSTLLKYGLILLAAAGVLFGAFELGSSHGYTVGYAAADLKDQATIKAMVDATNAQTAAQNAKITSLEQDAMLATGKIFTANAAAATTRVTVVKEYAKANPVVAASCGWDIPTAETINALIDADPNNAIPDAAAAASDASAASTPTPVASAPTAASAPTPATATATAPIGASQ